MNYPMARISCIFFVVMSYCMTDDAATGAEIRGVVLDSNSGEPISNVAIQIAGLGSRTISDPTGHFRLTDIPEGDHSLNVSSIGYWPVTAQFHVDSGAAKEFEVVLTPETQRRVDAVSVPARYDSL